MADTSPLSDFRTPGLGETQRRILEQLKLGGELTLAELGEAFDLARETLREHLNALAARGLVRRAGRRRRGPGRPENLYALDEAGEALFPRREGDVLRQLARHLLEGGRSDELEDFFRRRVAAVGDEALGRVSGLEGRERLEAVAEMLSEEGFMARIVEGEDGRPRLRLHHCPLQDLVEATRLPCRAELAWVGDALGEPLERESFMPEGDRTCSYAVGRPEGGGGGAQPPDEGPRDGEAAGEGSGG